MRVARVWLIVVACLVAGTPEVAAGPGIVQARGMAGAGDECRRISCAMESDPGLERGDRAAKAPCSFFIAALIRFLNSTQLENSFARGATGLISEGKVAGIPKENFGPDRSRYSAVYGPAGCTACGAHSVRVDPQGNIWIVDATAHVVYKMSADGKEIMRLGTKGTSGASQTTFNLPTDIAFAANGDLYVTDGYGGARVVKFSRDGKYLLEWGKRGTGPGEFGLASQRRG